jgi:hypothetical protein
MPHALAIEPSGADADATRDTFDRFAAGDGRSRTALPGAATRSSRSFKAVFLLVASSVIAASGTSTSTLTSARAQALLPVQPLESRRRSSSWDN